MFASVLAPTRNFAISRLSKRFTKQSYKSFYRKYSSETPKKPVNLTGWSANYLIQNDSQLSNNPAFSKLHEKFGKIASQDAIQKTKKALEQKGHLVSIVPTKAAALETIITTIPQGSSIHMTGSTTLVRDLSDCQLPKYGFQIARVLTNFSPSCRCDDLITLKSEIGLIDYLNGKHKWINNKEKFLIESDPIKAAQLRRYANISDYALTTADAITQDGQILVIDASGTRVSVYHAAGKVLVIAGSNKIVADQSAAEERAHSYTYQLESARIRKAYPGMTGSTVSNELFIRSNTFFKERMHVIIIEETAGF